MKATHLYLYSTYLCKNDNAAYNIKFREKKKTQPEMTSTKL